jgi:raffinose/stachyose/melibiose transport system substrate-binding protein
MKRLHPNWIGLGLLVVAWTYSAVRFAAISADRAAEEDPDDGNKVIRILHWQLEPGYPEGMQMVIDAYNQLPHVQENRVFVKQMAVTERVYAQFLNVHLISGTAPDICEKGMSSILGDGAQLARFFAPVSGFVKEPNPYNAPEYFPGGMSEDLKSRLDPDGSKLPDEIDPELAHYLQTSAWSETFTDGMLGGWDDALQDYIAVPVSSWGALRTFYNKDLTARIKTFLQEQWDASPRPDWLTQLVVEERMVPEDEAFLAWLRSPEVPDSLGRFILFCEATLRYGAAIGNDKLVPISASSYFIGNMVESFVVPFTYPLARKLDLDHNSYIGHEEFIGGWGAGLWSYQDPHLKDGFYDVARWLARYYPPGYLGLDREQAARRFIHSNALFITTGGWDASTLFEGAEGKFEVGVIPAPVPVEGERWFPYSAGQPNEAENRVGAPMAINKESRNFDWAVDFLRFMTSFSANQAMNREAGWIPSVVGAQPNEDMRPFLPRTEGVKSSMRLAPGDFQMVSHVYNGKFPLYQAGEISYEEFAQEVEDSYRNERNGVDRYWYEMFVSTRDRARQLERSMIVSRLRGQLQGWEKDNLMKHNNLLEYSLPILDGDMLKAKFHDYFPDRPFPEY